MSGRNAAVARLGALALFLTVFGALACGGDGSGDNDTAAPQDAIGEDSKLETVDALTPEVGTSEASDEDLTSPEVETVAETVETVIETTPEEITPPFELFEGAFGPLCQVGCVDDPDCPQPGWRCLTFQESGQTFCSSPCGSNPNAITCPAGFGCVAVSGTDLCVPLGGDCHGATAQAPCGGTELDGLCKYDAPRCTGSEAHQGYCTKDCEDMSGCRGGYTGCVDDGQGGSWCRAVFEDSADGCGISGAIAQAPGSACAGDDDCLAPNICVAPTGAEVFSPFCASPCDDSPCASGELCRPVSDQDDAPSYCLAPACHCLAPRPGLYTEALALVDLDACKATFSRDWLLVYPEPLAHDPWRLPVFHHMHDEPSRALPQVDAWLAELDAPEGLDRVSASITLAARTLDMSFDDMAGVDDSSADLPSAIERFIVTAGAQADRAGIAASLTEIPVELATALTPVVDGMWRVLLARQTISAEIDDPALEALFFSSLHGLVVWPQTLTAPAPANPAVREILLEGEGLRQLYRSARDISDAVAAADFLGLDLSAVPADLSVDIDTPVGPILIRGSAGGGLNEASLGGHANASLVLDLGGDDSYLIPAGATAAVDHPISVLIDLGGHDNYGYVPVLPAPHPLALPEDDHGRWEPSGTPGEINGPVSLSDHNRQGSGRLGAGMLFDLGEGSDEYSSLRLSQGSGVYGLGLLYDDGGDDVYAAEAVAQGAGIFGIGLLIDEAGDDDYAGFHGVQAFAYARSFGLLYDRSGDDDYVSHKGPDEGGFMLYLSSQNKGGSNSSLSQGMAFGRRADMSDGVFMSGGVAILRDLDGHDDYDADIMAQGSGYWFGTGVLADGSGNDTYDGRWYVQGSCAHMANCFFVEEAGDDIYNAEVNVIATSVGVGHDFSLGILDERGGDDTYHGPGLGLGSGNATGFGFLFDHAGADHYISTSGNAIGWANGTDRPSSASMGHLPTLGVFIDLGGADTYETVNSADLGMTDGASWLHPPTKPENAHGEFAVGVDSSAEGASLGLAF